MRKLTPRTKKLLKIFLGIFLSIILLLTLGITIFLIKITSEKNIKLTDIPVTQIFKDMTGQNQCTDENTTFTVSPIETQYITNIIPLGNLNPSGHTFPTKHMYYYIQQEEPEDFNSPSMEVPIYAPMNATLTNISTDVFENDTPPSTDYSLSFRSCEDFTFYFIHLTTLSEKLESLVDLEDTDSCDRYTAGGNTYYSCWTQTNIEIKAGDILGTVGGKIRPNFDFGVTDFRITPNITANPERWAQQEEDIPYIVCSTDYYSGALKETLESKLGGWNKGLRTIEPICGTITQDIPGTAQGIWFKEGTTNIHDEHSQLALVHDNIDPTIPVFSVGLSLENIKLGSGTYIFTPETNGNLNLDFNLVKPNSEIYCYDVRGSFSDQNQELSILLQMVDDNTMRIGAYNDPECKNIPTAIEDYIIFER